MEGQSAALRDWASTWPLFMKTLLAGGCAGAVAKTSTAPLERAKIMLQTRQARSVADALGSMWRAEGVRGLFRGNSAVRDASLPLGGRRGCKNQPRRGSSAACTSCAAAALDVGPAFFCL